VADSLALDDVRPLLRGRFGRPYRYADVTSSTQRLLQANDPEGAVAVAEEQTEGRGRLGRSWHAPAQTSILASVLLRPSVDQARLPELSLVAGRAVADAVTDVTGIEPTIKFPNDVLIAGRKVAGILAESSEGRVLLGIGVNVNQTSDELPVDAQTPPTSLRLELGDAVHRPELLATILFRLERAYEEWLTTGTSASR
jgi:BirA family biotin operon repressor/biotin-[acetyl-CoA-carboxylase] ligase